MSPHATSAMLVTSRAKNTTYSLVISVQQITDGVLPCDYCSRVAVALLATGADRVAKPHCAEHTASMLSACAAIFRHSGGEVASANIGTAA
jgi:hypothetical protein